MQSQTHREFHYWYSYIFGLQKVPKNGKKNDESQRCHRGQFVHSHPDQTKYCDFFLLIGLVLGWSGSTASATASITTVWCLSTLLSSIGKKRRGDFLHPYPIHH